MSQNLQTISYAWLLKVQPILVEIFWKWSRYLWNPFESAANTCRTLLKVQPILVEIFWKCNQYLWKSFKNATNTCENLDILTRQVGGSAGLGGTAELYSLEGSGEQNSELVAVCSNTNSERLVHFESLKRGHWPLAGPQRGDGIASSASSLSSSSSRLCADDEDLCHGSGGCAPSLGREQSVFPTHGGSGLGNLTKSAAAKA